MDRLSSYQLKRFIHMTTKVSRSSALVQLERIVGEPLSLGLLLRSIREGEAWSLAEMGAKLKVTRAYVASLERGKAVSPERAAIYAKRLGYGEAQFVRLSLQDSVRRAGLPFRVSLRPAA
jgi:plasmid maintenance system antidote protein VapI